MAAALDGKRLRLVFAAAFVVRKPSTVLPVCAPTKHREYARWREIVAETLIDVTDAEACFRELHAYFARPDAWRVQAEAGP